MSRPASRKGKTAKPKKKTPKQQIAELTEDNERLNIELQALKTDASGMREKLDIVTKKLVSNIRKKDFGITNDTDLSALPILTLTDIIDELVVKKQIYDKSVECRAAELEQRLTEMTLVVAKMTTKTRAYEMGLKTLAQCTRPEQTRDKIQTLMLIAGQEYHTFAANDPSRPDELTENGCQQDVDEATQKSLHNARLLDLTPPDTKLPGVTHVKHLHKDLRTYLIQELSQEKRSGCDWRRFAVRVDVDVDRISEWKLQKLQYPMSNVLEEWDGDEGASVRMLHRHLMSPQMRCTLLAKRVADFYNVV